MCCLSDFVCLQNKDLEKQIKDLEKRLAEALKPLPRGECSGTYAQKNMNLEERLRDADSVISTLKKNIEDLKKDNEDLKKTIESKAEVAHMKKKMDKLDKIIKALQSENGGAANHANRWMNAFYDDEKKLDMLLGHLVFNLFNFFNFPQLTTPTRPP